MWWSPKAAWIATLVGVGKSSASFLYASSLTNSSGAAADTQVYRDAETGFTFTQYNAGYTLGRTIAYKIAIPSGGTYNQPYDVVVQITAPSDVGWCGLAWGGHMTNNPLMVVWSGGYNVPPVISSRYASDHSRIPSPYNGASYQIFKTGSRSNSTHWQVTAKCTGCTTFAQPSGRLLTLDPNGSSRFAFAYASQKPQSPSSNTSTFNVHDVFNYWTHDFVGAANPQFSTLVAKNIQ